MGESPLARPCMKQNTETLPRYGVAFQKFCLMLISAFGATLLSAAPSFANTGYQLAYDLASLLLLIAPYTDPYTCSLV